MEERKQKIVDAAKKLFSEKGYSATGLREIAESAGVSTGNIYNHFKNKKEIFNCILDPVTLILSFPDFTTHIDENFPQNIEKLILEISRVIQENIELYMLIYIDLIEFDGYNANRGLEAFIKFGDN